MKRWASAALVGVAMMFSTVASGTESVTLTNEPWPVKRECEVCVPVQFGSLEMRLPLGDIGQLQIIGPETGAALAVLPKSGDLTEGVMLLTVPPKRGFKQLGFTAELKRLGITTNEQFFDRLGRAPNGNKALSAMRRAYNIDSAARYTKASKDGLHAYWVRPDEPIGKHNYMDNTIYLVVDGSDTAYMLGGVITQATYDTVLSNLRVVKKIP
jgi:hypothetical protein